MKALVLESYNKFTYTDVPDPELTDDGVLIKIHSCGICGSDVHGMDGSTGRRLPPVVMGHEASGVVEAVGAGVKDLTAGERVTFDSTVYCGHCWYCTKGLVNLCDNRRVLGVACDEYKMDGAFAQYVVVPARSIYVLPEELSFEHAAMVEPLSVAVHAVDRSGLRVGDSAAVVGTGMIGLLVVQVLRAAGCSPVIAVDLDPEKLKLADELGADTGLNPAAQDATVEIHKLTGGRGVDGALEVVGHEASIKTAAAVVRKGGSMTLVGNLSSHVQFPLQLAVTREITFNGTYASQGDYPVCISMLARKAVDVQRLISACASLEEGDRWFQRLYGKESGLMKVMLQP